MCTWFAHYTSVHSHLFVFYFTAQIATLSFGSGLGNRFSAAKTETSRGHGKGTEHLLPHRGARHVWTVGLAAERKRSQMSGEVNPGPWNQNYWTLAWRIEAGRADWEQVGSFQKAGHSDLKSENHLEDLGIQCYMQQAPSIQTLQAGKAPNL